MKIVRLLFILCVFACNTPKTELSNSFKEYYAFLRIDSLAKLYPDSAFYYYFTSSQNFTDSAYKATALQRMALIQQTAEDFNGSNESAIRSVSYFSEKKPKNHSLLSFNYNLLGSNCLELQRYDDAFRYYDEAIRLADSAYMLIYKINKGVAYQKVKKYGQAIELYEEVLKHPLIDSVYCRAVSNLAKARWLNDPGYPALNEFHEARALRESIGDQLGLNASYAHLADFYLKSRPDSAHYYANKMLQVALKLDRPDDQAEALEKLSRLSPRSNFNDYFPRYVVLKDSLNFARSNDRNQFADIRFNFEETKANNFLLEKDNSEKKLRITRQRIIIYGTIILFIVFSFLGVLWNKKKKKLQELQTQNRIRESELKTSQKVHDVVANGLYRIMTELEHTDHIEKEKVLDSVESLYEQSRDISYEHQVPLSTNFSDQLTAMLKSFASPTTKVFVVGNQEKIWDASTKQMKEELIFVLQELMVNMKKHSAAHNVVVKFHSDEDKFIIHYKDDGVGIPEDYQKGNGIRNTGNRINNLGGRINFDTKPGQGLGIDILLPLSTSK